MGRMLPGIGDGDRLVPAPEDALHRLVPTNRSLIEAPRHFGVSHEATLADRVAELGNVGDPERDGDGRHPEELREFGVAGAELTVIAGKSGVVRAIAGDGMADDTHGRYIGIKLLKSIYLRKYFTFLPNFVGEVSPSHGTADLQVRS